MNFVHIGFESIEKYGEYIFLNFENQKYTNIDLERLSNRLGRGLQQRGLRKNDRVMVFLTNMPEVLICYLAVLKTGAIVVPVHPAHPPQVLSYLINDSDPSMVITSTSLMETVRIARELSSLKPSMIAIGQNPHEDFIHFKECFADDDSFLLIDQSDNAIAAIIYTSGTTGMPKGVMLSHFNLYMNGHGDVQSGGLINVDGTQLLDKIRILAILPFTHVYGLSTIAITYLSGGTIFLMQSFDAEQILNAIQENEITVFLGTPLMYSRLGNFVDAEKYNVRSVARWFSSAAPLSSEVRNSFEKKYNATILEGYGLTETTSAFSLQRQDRLIKNGSVGPVVPISEVRIVDDKDRPLPPGHVGEITYKGPNVMKGYYNNEQETARVLKEGWLYTGDIGYMDEDGDIFIVDRKIDLIIRDGFRIYPSEVETVLCEHPDISDACVVGVVDKKHGEQVCAFVVQNKGAKTNKKDIQSFCHLHLVTYKVPHYIEYCESLPKNELGRTLRRELKYKANLRNPISVEKDSSALKELSLLREGLQNV